MKDIRTRTHAFDSSFFIERQNPKMIMARIANSTIREISDVFNNPIELAELSFRGRQYHGYTRCRIRDEGNQVFLIIE
jgi:hypothetical protein